MKTNDNSRWVLGHLITPISVSGEFDLVLGETPPHTPGPPPHRHAGYNEVFLVTKGQMDFVIDGAPMTVGAGESVDLPPGTLHTFGNNSDEACHWVNIHSPKGFRSFFEDIGIPAEEADARARSVTNEVIQRVMQTAADYDMLIELPEPAPQT